MRRRSLVERTGMKNLMQVGALFSRFFPFFFDDGEHDDGNDENDGNDDDENGDNDDDEVDANV